MKTELIPHPQSKPGAVRGLTVEVTRIGPRRIGLTYAITANFRQVRWPMEARPRRTEGLWRRTCFEAFIKAPDRDTYFEFNISPSRQWAAWRFSAYREGMKAEQRIDLIRVDTRSRGEDCLLVSADIDMDRLTELPLDAPMLLGLSAVIEERNGRLSYWALAHPPGAPDFHHADCFRLELAAARRP